MREITFTDALAEAMAVGRVQRTESFSVSIGLKSLDFRLD